MQNYDNFINGKFTPVHRQRAHRGNESIDRRGHLHGARQHRRRCRSRDRRRRDGTRELGAKSPAMQRAQALRAIAPKIREKVGTASPASSPRSKARFSAWRASRFPSPPTTSTTWRSGRAASKARFWRATGPAKRIFLFRQPIGVIGGILPWNFPFFLIARKAAPALVTGNTIVIKPSEETPHNAVKFCELLAQTDLPPGVINIVHGRGATAGKSAGVVADASA